MQGGTVKLGDFGLSTVSGAVPQARTENRVSADITVRSGRHTKGLGTPTYASPEQIAGGNYSEKTDIFSLGMVMFECFNPTSTAMERHILFHEAREGRFPELFRTKYPKEAALCRKMLASNPRERPTTWEIAENVLMLGNHSAERRLQEQSAMLSSMQQTIRHQNTEIRELSRGHMGSMPAEPIIELGEPQVVLVEPPVQSAVFFTGTWTPHTHVQCFWGFRAQIHATVASIFLSNHAMQCEAMIENTGEYRTWSIKRENIVQVVLYHMLAQQLWQKSLSWMVGPQA